MNYQKQYSTKISWKNSPDTSTPLNATNLNKMDNALWYMDNALYILSNAIGGGSSIRGGIIDNVGGNMFRTHIHQRTGESLVADELLLLRSEVSGTGTSINVYTDQSSAQGVEFLDLDGESTSVTLTDESIMFLLMVDEYSAKVLAVLNANDSGLAGLGIGKMKSYTNNVIDTDIDLYRDPIINDRILLYCTSDISVSSSTSIKTYVNGTAVTTNIGPMLPQTLVKGFNVLQCVAGIPNGMAWNVKLNVPIVAYSAGTGISIDNNGVISNTNPSYGENYDYKKIDSAIDDGDLGEYNGYCDNLIIDFHANAVSGGDAYTLTLLTGTTSITRKYAVLKDRSGNPFTRDINAGMILKCESNVSGSGTELDPVVVMVLEIGNWYVESGRKANTIIGARSTAEGEYNTVSGAYGHADGYGNTASGNSASAHGIASTASGDCSVADGSYTTASGANASAHGDSTIASGVDSSASGEGTIAGYLHQTAMGRFNENKSGNLLEVGNGSDDDNRSNALEVTADGNVVAGNDIVDGNGYTLSSIVDAISEEKTVSGNPVTVTDALPYNAVSLSAEIEASQDLHGLPFPYVGGAYKNKLPMTIAGIKAANTGGTWNGNVYSINNVTVTILTDTDDNVVGFKFNGTPNATITFIIANTAYIDYSVLSGKNCYLSGCPSGGDYSVYKLQYWSANYQRVDIGSGVAISFPSSAPTSCNFAILLYSGVQANNLIFYPQCEIGDSATTFAPWENKCPISGRTETSVLDHGKNQLDKALMTEISTTAKSVTLNLLPNTTYTMSSNHPLASGAASVFFVLDVSSYSTSQDGVWNGQTRTITTGADGKAYVIYRQIGGETDTEFQSYNYQIEYGAIATPYVPYVTPNTVTIQLGQTVYGGTLNVTTGVLTIDRMGHTFDGTEDITVLDNRFVYNKTGESPQGNNDYNCISSHYKSETNLIVYQNRNTAGFVGMCAHGSAVIWNDNIHFMSNDVTAYKAYLVAQHTAGTPLTAVWKLATPQTIQLTPTQLQMLKGYNRLSSDGGGDITLTYKADRLAAIEAALAQIGA